ncbi:hypothetical protein LWI29_004678 [Acer saccharum]|uniref:Uncharacterized protein n=1 Tax=Acer saccharum TaxID=4024 RepID=A0AA39RKQ5_ACESA|nr:hypothetical protein LWI29_004678 [Acer saccharum]
MMGMGDLSPSDDDDDAELREADTIRQNRSSSCASQQQTTDGTTAPAKRTHLRFVSSRRRGGHDGKRQSPVREDSVPLPQQDSAVVHGTETSQQGIAALPYKDTVPPPQQDIVIGASDVEQSLQDTVGTSAVVRERKRNAQTITPYTDLCRRKKSKTEAAHKFRPADPIHKEHLDAYLQFKLKRTEMCAVDRGNRYTVPWFKEFKTNHAELENTAHMYRIWVSMFDDVKTPLDNQKWSVLTQTWDDEGDLIWANGLRASGCRPWNEIDTVSVLETKKEIRFHISTYLTRLYIAM